MDERGEECRIEENNKDSAATSTKRSRILKKRAGGGLRASRENSVEGDHGVL